MKISLQKQQQALEASLEQRKVRPTNPTSAQKDGESLLSLRKPYMAWPRLCDSSGSPVWRTEYDKNDAKECDDQTMAGESYNKQRSASWTAASHAMIKSTGTPMHPVLPEGSKTDEKKEEKKDEQKEDKKDGNKKEQNLAQQRELVAARARNVLEEQKMVEGAEKKGDDKEEEDNDGNDTGNDDEDKEDNKDKNEKNTELVGRREMTRLRAGSSPLVPSRESKGTK
eukprot:gnl/TRDRNA2_/TRDRNA2_164745_c2_seq3.p1 gnl/TRDRNA2_/TRDRNA2_164745_c2~~gnl/TRDRNA2_/TRDRNA2_164745_c2_seq3.p1  ORF type:complete len:226 (+),score=65.41 gnl/TRDRNA2_/TRDRNA2_164745_c2_seq3:56-733(+)